MCGLFIGLPVSCMVEWFYLIIFRDWRDMMAAMKDFFSQSLMPASWISTFVVLTWKMEPDGTNDYRPISKNPS